MGMPRLLGYEQSRSLVLLIALPGDITSPGARRPLMDGGGDAPLILLLQSSLFLRIELATLPRD